MSVIFCGICRHEMPGHEPDCPVLTQEPVRGIGYSQQQASQYGLYGSPPYGQSDTEARILAELARLRDDVRTLAHMVGELLARK